MKPLLSIIIPTYNSSLTIRNTLESIKIQTFTDFEILIIDNCSTDGTLDIVEVFRSTLKNIKVISEPDKGIYDAMNKGITIAKGDWLYFIGSDDRLLNNDVLKNIFNSNIENYDVIYGNVLSDRLGGQYAGEFTLEKLMSQNICHQAIFFRKTVYKLIGNFETKYLSHADWDHNLRWFLNPKIRVKFVNLDIAEYGDGGFSSRFPDLLFASEKNIRIIKYGLFRLPSKILRELSFDEYNKARLSGNHKRAFVLKIVNFYASVCLKYQL